MSAPWARNGWAGAEDAGPGAPLGGISVPDFDAVYFWSVNAGVPGYGQGTWGGGQFTTIPGGGLLASPDPGLGTVTIAAWWAQADDLILTRVTEDGSRTRVRSANPWQVTGATRRNDATNPAAHDDLSGYAQRSGEPALQRLTGLSLPSGSRVTTAVRATATSGGASGIVFNTENVPTYTSTYGFWVRTSTLPTSLALSVQWWDVDSSSLGSSTHPVSDVARTQSVGAWSWCTVTVSPLTGAVTGQATLAATGLGSGGKLDVTGRIWQEGATLDGDYFDGDYPGGIWLGTSGKSRSMLAPIQWVLDGEAPLDIPVHYELTNPATPGYLATSQTVTLGSRGNRTWLTHPSQPTDPIRVEILGPFGPVSRKIVQGTYYPLDSTDGLPIVKTQSRRRGREGSIKFLSISHEERDRLLGLFDDGSPVLIRAPKSYGHGPAMWLSLGDLTEDQAAYWSESPFRTLSADYTEVAAPLTANEVA